MACAASTPSVAVWRNGRLEEIESEQVPSGILTFRPFIDCKVTSQQNKMEYISEKSFKLWVYAVIPKPIHILCPFGKVDSGYSLPILPTTIVLSGVCNDDSKLMDIEATYKSINCYQIDLSKYHLSEECYPIRFTVNIDA